MNKITVLFCTILFCFSPLFNRAQTTPKAAPQQAQPQAPKPAAGGARTPYVLKKDYEAQMEGIAARISAAAGGSAAVRREMNEKFSKMSELDEKMQKVEEILNSANFQIALTSDSLKTTRNSMEEFRKQAEANILALQKENTGLKDQLMMLMGLCLLLPIVVFVVLFILIRKQKSAVHKEWEALHRKITSELHKQQTAITEEMQAQKTKMSGEVFSLKAELSTKINRDSVDVNAQLKTISVQLAELTAKFEALQKPEDDTTDNGN